MGKNKDEVKIYLSNNVTYKSNKYRKGENVVSEEVAKALNDYVVDAPKKDK